MTYVRVTAALAAAALLTFVSHAQAQSIPPQGELHVTFTTTQVPPVAPRGGLGCLNRFSASISGASAGVRLPSGAAAG